MLIKELINKKPDEIIEWFDSKTDTTTWNWDDIFQEAHTKAFTVAKCTQADILQDIRKAVSKSISDGIPFEQFKNELTPLLEKKGWWGVKKLINPKTGEKQLVQLGSNRRLETIYNTNIRTAFLAGRYEAMTENAKEKPYWRYVCQMRATSREEHKALHNKVLRYDDPFWDTMYPPNGWGCGCTVQPMSRDDIKRYNKLLDSGSIKTPGSKLSVEKSGENLIDVKQVGADGQTVSVKGYKDPKTGSITVPGRGWNYCVGKRDWSPDFSKYDDEVKKRLIPVIENKEGLVKNDGNNKKSSIINKETNADKIIKECIKKSDITNNERLSVLSELAKEINNDVKVELGEFTDFGKNYKITISEETNKVNIGGVAVKIDDNRPYQYKIKTIFHELTHLRNHNQLSGDDIEYLLYSYERKYNLEEVFAETVGHYHVKKKYGINEIINPSYPEDMAKTLPNLMKLEDFKDCKYIEDFGEVINNKYLNNQDAVKQLTKQLNATKYTSPDNYIKKNIDRIIDSKDDIVNIYYDIFKDDGNTKEEINNYINNIDNINDLKKCRIISALFAIKGV